MRDSYILNRELTTAQRAELERLPEHFRLLDQEFHVRAERLDAAARARDAEAVAFQLSRLLESCVSCHSAFAGARFPGFATAPSDAHRH
jgi:cytochrome c556